MGVSRIVGGTKDSRPSAPPMTQDGGRIAEGEKRWTDEALSYFLSCVIDCLEELLQRIEALEARR
jgi:hypothetical protein